jgi:DNA polymerase-3 subunit epsilon
VVVVRHGRLCATATTPDGSDPRSTIAALLATAEHASTPCLPASSAHPEETDLVLRWLDQTGVRLVEVGEGWACPVRGAEAYRAEAGATPAAVAVRRLARTPAEHRGDAATTPMSTASIAGDAGADDADRDSAA